MFSFLLLLNLVGISSELTPEIIDQVEAQLSDSCGSPCTRILQDIVPLMTSHHSNSGDSSAAKLERLSDFIHGLTAQGNEARSNILKNLQELTVSSSFADPIAESQMKRGNVRKEPPMQPDIPCRTQAECVSLDFKINRCSHIRRNAMQAYVGANAAVAVLANLITALCGCIFAGPVNICVLQGVPYVCGFPFEAYQGLFSVSTALFTAVKLTTSVCPYVGTDLI